MTELHADMMMTGSLKYLRTFFSETYWRLCSFDRSTEFQRSDSSMDSTSFPQYECCGGEDGSIVAAEERSMVTIVSGS